jgi:predicted DNA-binding transcriptional regulator YafY
VRADRLVAILLLLQTRGRVTAAEVAAELEVSERTARRDLEALGMAGIPVYALQGRHGGWRLAGGGRTDLSGLSAAEARALFLVAGPASAASPDVRAALRKLVRALPEPLRSPAEAASAAVVVDPAGWEDRTATRPPPPHLDALQQAVVDGEQVRLEYMARDRAVTTRVVHPLGLAAKGRTWYLVAGTDSGRRTFRVDRVISVERTGDPVVKPQGFDLAATWAEIAREVDRMRTPVLARAVVERDFVWILRSILGSRVGIGAAGDDGRVEVQMRGHSIRSLAGEIAGLGTRVRVLDPPELQSALAGIGEQLVAAYGGAGHPAMSGSPDPPVDRARATSTRPRNA